MATDSVVISMRLSQKSEKRLKRMANQHGWTLSDTSAQLVEEGLRRAEFGFIDFRDSAAGRQACVQGSSLAVWEVMNIARDFGRNVESVAKHLRWPETRVQAAFNYAKAYPGEIDAAIAENDETDFDALSRMLPGMKKFVAGGRGKNS